MLLAFKGYVTVTFQRGVSGSRVFWDVESDRHVEMDPGAVPLERNLLNRMNRVSNDP